MVLLLRIIGKLYIAYLVAMQYIDCMKASPNRLSLQSLTALIPTNLPMSQKPAEGWLRAIRNTLSTSQHKLAARLGISRQAYAQFETGEKNGTISMNSLQRAADAMDCDLVYFVVPRNSIADSKNQIPVPTTTHSQEETDSEPLSANVSTDLFQSGIVSLPLDKNPADGS